MSRIVRFHKYGSADELQLEDVPPAEPAAGEVRIRVEAFALNRAEILLRRGEYFEQVTFPSRLGYDAAGVVEAVGPGVKEFRTGDRVLTTPAHSQVQYGVYGEWAIVPASSLLKYPERLSAVEASAVGVQYFTGYFGLIELGKLAAGMAVLITAASSSTGVAAIQLAKLVGARVIATTRTSKKRQQLLEHGADAVVATAEENLVERVKALTDGQGADVVYDPIAGAAVAQYVDLLAFRGRLVLYGLLDSSPATLPIWPLMGKGLTIHGYAVFDFMGFPAAAIPPRPEAVARARRFIAEKLADGALRPVIARTFRLEQVADAHRLMESNEQVGKIVVTCG